MTERVLSIPDISSLGCSSATLVCRGSALKPDLFLLNFDDGRDPIVYKTFAFKSSLVRLTVGRFVTWRERRVLARLKDIDGISRLVCPALRSGLCLELVPGRPLSRFRSGELAEDVFQELVAVVKRIHQAGVVHLDLSHRGNILVTTDEQPVIIDFQSALSVKWWPRVIRKWFERIDELAILRWKNKRFSQCLTPEDLAAVKYRKKIAQLWPFG